MALNTLVGAALLLLLVSSSAIDPLEAGLIKDIFQKVTHTNNKTESIVRESVPICGNGLFSTPNEGSLSPEIIFISTKPSRIESVRLSSTTSGSPLAARLNRQTDHYDQTSGNNNNNNNDHQRRRNNNNINQQQQQKQPISEISKEFRFHADNVTVDELRRYGFNPNAPVSFLIHGFTSGYPLQAWLSAIVEAYTIDRETSGSSNNPDATSHQGASNQAGGDRDHGAYENSQASGNHRDQFNSNDRNKHKQDNYKRRDTSSGSSSSSSRRDRDRDGQQDRVPIDNNRQYEGSQANANANHNLFIVNWNYAARGILYPRAVANIPIVASYVTRFINNKLIDEARVDPNRIQLIGHSLGAHLAGFIGKNTRNKVGRIYGLDPAGPCFGTLTGPLYPSSKRLAPSDANEVITIQTNSALLGIDKPLGKYSVFVEGGANQPGCKPSGVLKSIGTLTWDGGDFDTVACSHSRAPNLLTYRYDQSDAEDECQMVAYACKDWPAFLAGQCGVCQPRGGQEEGRDTSGGSGRRGGRSKQNSPLDPVECYRIGLDWSNPTFSKQSSSSSSYNSNKYNEHDENVHNNGNGNPSHLSSSSSIVHDNFNKPNRHFSSTRRPFSANNNYQSSADNDNYHGQSANSRRHSNSSASSLNNAANGLSMNRDRLRRDTIVVGDQEGKNSSTTGNTGAEHKQAPVQVDERRRLRDNDDDNDDRDSVEPILMFLRTGDTQPYCTFHYQVILELNSPLGRKRPPMSIILQDSEPDDGGGGGGRRRPKSGREQNSLSSDEFGTRFNDKMYTHLLTSSKKLQQIDHATMIFRDGLQNGHEVLKALHVNYMSHSDKKVRDRLSSRLCPIRAEIDRSSTATNSNTRFYFKPCNERDQQHSHSHSSASSQQGSSSWSSSPHDQHSSSNEYNSNNHDGQHDSNSNLRQPSRRPNSNNAQYDQN